MSVSMKDTPQYRRGVKQIRDWKMYCASHPNRTRELAIEERNLKGVTSVADYDIIEWAKAGGAKRALERMAKK